MNTRSMMKHCFSLRCLIWMNFFRKFFYNVIQPLRYLYFIQALQGVLVIKFTRLMLKPFT